MRHIHDLLSRNRSYKKCTLMVYQVRIYCIVNHMVHTVALRNLCNNLNKNLCGNISWSMNYVSSNKNNINEYISRSSHQRCSIKKCVLRNFAKFTGKHLCQSLFFNKVAGLRPATLLKKETLAQVFSCEFYEISKNTIFTEHLWTTASVYLNFLRSFESSGSFDLIYL